MIQQLSLACAFILLVASGSVFGLGLGKLELGSALNQQFEAEIELTNVGQLTIDEVLPNLASQDDFARVGVERNDILTDLRFKVVANSQGKLVLKVTSTRPIIEPFLNFIVEVLWPSGRILREYIVLLDPPVLTEAGFAPIKLTEVIRDGGVSSSSSSATQSAAARNAAAFNSNTIDRASIIPDVVESKSGGDIKIGRSALQEGADLSEGFGATGRGDTLWSIASKIRPNSTVSVQQTMLALQRANPDAFINSNINLLKAGYVLRIPDAREIREETLATAAQEVRAQNSEFDVYRDNSGVAQLDASQRQSSPSFRERSVRGGELKLLAQDQSIGQRAGSGGDSQITQELENSLAVAQEDLDRANRANAELNVRVEDIEQQMDTLTELVKLKEDQLAALRVEVQRMQAQESALRADSGALNQPQTPSDDGALLSNPIVLGLLAVLLVVGVAGGLLLMRRKQQEETEYDEALEEETREAAQLDVENLPELDDDDSEFDDPEFDDEDEDEDEDEDDIMPQTADVISEVEIHIAYGRFSQAIIFLQNAIEADPDRVDIQLKLLEVYVQTEDSSAFNQQFDQLKTLGDEVANEQALAMQAKVLDVDASAAASMDATMISADPIVSRETTTENDDLSFDLDELDSERDDDSFDFEDDLDLDLDLDLDDDLELDDDFDLDDDLELDDDFDLDDELELDDNLESDVDLGEDLGEDVEVSESLSLEDDALELSPEDSDSDPDEALAAEAALDTDDDNDAFEIDLSDLDLDLDLEGEDIDLDDEYELDLEEDIETKLDLARAYIDMGDKEGARGVLQEVSREGNESEIAKAKELFESISD
jgi:pilus assembly protein FimV